MTMTANEARPAVNPLADQNADRPTPDPLTLAIFGATGDLTKRKLVPALYALASDGLLPTDFTILGTGRTEMSTEEFRASMREGTREHSRVSFDEAVWNSFEEHLNYVAVDIVHQGGLAPLKHALDAIESERQTSGNRIYYFSIPPSGIAALGARLGEEGFAAEVNGHRRIIIEKPFGRNLETARALTADLLTVFREDQIYRIDHYLGKETVQNLLVFRFANGIFEPIWNRRYIDHVQITMAETLGIEGRGKYYEEAGALRDIVQNHLMQLMAIIGMEPPSNFQPETVRDEKVKFLRAVRPVSPENALQHTVRGQYASGWVDGEHVIGYREERDVDPKSLRETFVAMKIDIDNWRWAGTPFYLRAGKHLPKRATEIAIQFRRVPHSPFEGIAGSANIATGAETIEPNVLVLRIQPDEGITLRFSAKIPGQAMRIRSVNMDFLYGASFLQQSPEAYERLLLDCMLGDATLFARGDEVEEAWRFCTAILDGWRAQPPDPINTPNYEAGTWGPLEAREFIARDGREWRRL